VARDRRCSGAGLLPVPPFYSVVIVRPEKPLACRNGAIGDMLGAQWGAEDIERNMCGWVVPLFRGVLLAQTWETSGRIFGRCEFRRFHEQVAVDVEDDGAACRSLRLFGYSSPEIQRAKRDAGDCGRIPALATEVRASRHNQEDRPYAEGGVSLVAFRLTSLRIYVFPALSNCVHFFLGNLSFFTILTFANSMNVID
jgi:hypothetical protein